MPSPCVIHPVEFHTRKHLHYINNRKIPLVCHKEKQLLVTHQGNESERGINLTSCFPPLPPQCSHSSLMLITGLRREEQNHWNSRQRHRHKGRILCKRQGQLCSPDLLQAKSMHLVVQPITWYMPEIFSRGSGPRSGPQQDVNRCRCSGHHHFLSKLLLT